MTSEFNRQTHLMNKITRAAFFVLIIGMLPALPAFAEQMSNHELTERITALEAKLAQGGGASGGWTDRITLSGALEVEAGYEKINYSDPRLEDEDATDFALATAELGIEADIADHVSGNVLFLYEDDEDVVVDEAVITFSGEDTLPLYLNMGKLYVPFGNFKSHFISDPLTLEIGEARETAVTGGYADDMFDISATLFNGDVDEVDNDNHIESHVLSAVFTLPAERLQDVGLTVGASYISNIAEADGLEGESAGAVKDYVGGVGFFASVAFQERFFFEMEYVGAVEEFEAGELNFDGGKAVAPATWNIEFAFAPSEKVGLAARYEGSDEADFLPERQYGVCITYSLFESTSLGVEYLHGEFENDDETDIVTAQLAIAF